MYSFPFPLPKTINRIYSESCLNICACAQITGNISNNLTGKYVITIYYTELEAVKVYVKRLIFLFLLL